MSGTYRDQKVSDPLKWPQKVTVMNGDVARLAGLRLSPQTILEAEMTCTKQQGAKVPDSSLSLAFSFICIEESKRSAKAAWPGAQECMTSVAHT